MTPESEDQVVDPCDEIQAGKQSVVQAQQRAKVYQLGDKGQWIDIGTGYVSFTTENVKFDDMVIGASPGDGFQQS